MDESTLQEVSGAIKQGLDSGKSLDEVKEFMRGAGYSDGDIENAISRLDTPKVETPVEPASNAIESKPNFCNKCGDPIEKGEIFCSNCGLNLQAKPEASKVVAAQPVKPKKKSRKGLALMLLIILVLAVVGIYYLFSQVSSPTGAAVYGVVYDYSDKPVEGTRVSIGLDSTTTDSRGNFEINLKSANRQVMSFEHYNYVPIHKIVPADADGRLYYKVLMAEKEPFITMKQTSSGTANADEVTLRFEKESFGPLGGNFTPEEVSISLTYFDPRDEKDIEIFPGDFEAEDNSALESFGFTKVIVRDADGKDLDLVNNKTAKIKIKAAGNCAELPEEMPLWYFDEGAGYWTYKTTATKTGSGSNCFYEGEIDTVASWWNCDHQFERSWWELLIGFFADLFEADEGDPASFDDENWDSMWDDGEDPFDQFDEFDEFDDVVGPLYEMNTNDLANAYDLDTLVENLKEDEVLVHAMSYDRSGDAAYTAVDLDQVLAWEAAQNNAGDWVFDTGAAMEGGGFAGWFIDTFYSDDRILNNIATSESGVESMGEFLRSEGSQYDSYNSIMNFVNTLDGSPGDIEAIYDTVLSTISHDQTITSQTNFDMSNALESGYGICRHQAVVLADALNNAGYDASVVINDHHAWTRVTQGGRTFDLDPNFYQTYVELPPRNVNPAQVRNIGSPTGMAVASGESIRPVLENKRYCSKMGNCMYLTVPTTVYSDDAFGFEMWQDYDEGKVLLNFIENSGFVFDASNSDSTPINILGRERGAVSFSQVIGGDIVYFMYSDFGNGRTIVQIISDSPILENAELIQTLTGDRPEIERDLSDAELTPSGEELTQFLENFELDDTQFTARIDGVDYNYKDEEFFDPTQETKIRIAGRGDATSEISIRLGETTIFKTTETSGVFGEINQIYVGPVPIAGARITISLDSWYSGEISGFLVFESGDGELRSSMPVVVSPGAPKVFKMPLPSGKAGKISFQTFDFMTSGVAVSPVERLTMTDIELDIPKSCGLQRTVLIAFDNSGSMSGVSDADSSITKEKLMMEVITDLVAGFGGNTNFGLMALGNCPCIAQIDGGEIIWKSVCIDELDELLDKKFLFSTQDKRVIGEALEISMECSDSSIESPIILSLEILKNSISPTKRIIALTDGEASFSFEKYEEALVPGVEVSTVGIFSQGKSEDSSELVLLRDVAEKGGGEFYYVSDYSAFYSALESSAKGC